MDSAELFDMVCYKLEQIKKQNKMLVRCIEIYADEDNWSCDEPCGWEDSIFRLEIKDIFGNCHGYNLAKDILGEVDNES